MGQVREFFQKLFRRLSFPSAQKSIGQLGEDAACRFLKKLGYQILDRNFRIPEGEIDIIAEKENLIAFVEVKTLQNPDRKPQDAVNKRKQRKITRTAHHYLKRKGLMQCKHRFDIIAVHLLDGQEPKIQHFACAFSP